MSRGRQREDCGWSDGRSSARACPLPSSNLAALDPSLHPALPRPPTQGGEYFSHLKARGRLGEEGARLYAGEVLLMLEHLHSRDIVYRDLKVSW